MDVNALIDRYIALRNTKTGVGSATGYQLEKLRDGMSLGSYHNVHAQEESRIYYATLVYIFERLLTQPQRVVLFYLRTPIGTKPHQRQCREGDLWRKSIVGEETIQETRQGERYIGPCGDGWVTVEGLKPVYPTREEAATALGVTFEDVKRLVRSAYTKIRESQQYEAMNRVGEE